eukprot:751152-Hanusia_phi.AAC.3
MAVQSELCTRPLSSPPPKPGMKEQERMGRHMDESSLAESTRRPSEEKRTRLTGAECPSMMRMRGSISAGLLSQRNQGWRIEPSCQCLRAIRARVEEEELLAASWKVEEASEEIFLKFCEMNLCISCILL